MVFHNLKGYDGHIIIKHLSKFQTTKDVSVIAMNMEKYLSFQLDGLRFIDSLQFLNCGLDVLVKNLVKEGTYFISRTSVLKTTSSGHEQTWTDWTDVTTADGFI